MAIRLRRRGIDDFVVLERRARASAAPGATTPIPAAPATCPPTSTRSPSRPNPDWTRPFSAQPEIHALPRADCAERLRRERPHPLRHRGDRRAAGTRTRARWRRRDLDQGRLRAQFLIARDRRPGRAAAARRSPGSTDFEGEVFHSARWDHDYDLRGKRVAVDRHRRLGDPVRPPDPARGRAAARSSSAPRAWVRAAPRPADHRGSSGRCSAASRASSG